MVKKLNMIYNWIGPKGPITNTRIPNALDLTKNIFNLSNMTLSSQGLDPLYYQIKDYVDVNLMTPLWLENNESNFVYELEMLHTRDWESNFKVGFGLFENTKIPELVAYHIKEKSGYVLFTTPMESFLNDHILNQIHTYCSHYNIPMSKVIYLTNCINCKDVYDKYCKKRSITDKMNCEYTGTWVNYLVPTCQSPILNEPYKPGPRTKTFLNFNRRYREQRLIFIIEIFKRNILDDFYISFMREEPENRIFFVDEAKKVINHFELNLNEPRLFELNEKLPLVLDTDNLNVFPVEKNLDDTKRFYDDSLIHIIAETNFFGNIMHLTEKTLKPIMYKQPFIVVGPQYSLEYIKRLGFRTFSEIWDESYDTIEHDMDRMYKVLNLIESISKKSEQEKIEISYKVADIVNFNFNRMKNRKPFELYDFIERYGA